MSPFNKEDFANLYDREVWSVYGFIGYRLTSRAMSKISPSRLSRRR